MRQGYEFHGTFNGFRVCATPVHAGATPFSAIVGWGHPHVVAWPPGQVSVRPRPSYCLAGGRMAGGSWWGSFLQAPRLLPCCLNCFEGEDYGGALIHRHHQDNDQHRTVVRSNQPSPSAPGLVLLHPFSSLLDFSFTLEIASSKHWRLLSVRYHYGWPHAGVQDPFQPQLRYPSSSSPERTAGTHCSSVSHSWFLAGHGDENDKHASGRNDHTHTCRLVWFKQGGLYVLSWLLGNR